MFITTSLRPPSSLNDSEITVVDHLILSLNLWYIRNKSAANSAASSPPVPALISSIPDFTSRLSFGINARIKSSSIVANCLVRLLSSSATSTFISGSSIINLISSISRITFL